MSANDFYLLLDTADSLSGKITENGKLSFRSSWGVWNSAKKSVKFEYKISQKTILEHLGLQNNPNITIKSIKPSKIGFLPIAAITDPPISEAHLNFRKIYFEKDQGLPLLANSKQRLLLPEGHAVGTEFWKGLVTGLLVIPGAIFAILSTFASGGSSLLALAAWIAKGGLGIGLTNSVVQSYKWDNGWKKELQNRKIEAKKIYEQIMTRPFKINAINKSFSNYQQNAEIKIETELEAHANATSIWGDRSEMYIHNVLTAINAEVVFEGRF
ncbi:hypothetical protein [Mycoplasma sp. ATU-Cv-508]|uniref:hypothetical protein n=1 Tax=Mycoplasma sp. ATU-Cv-508 TaxID=2048001 RepID=UPI000FDF1FB8